jgi:hypothetical protein
MLRARTAKEVVVRVRNDIGVLATLTKLLAEKGINLLAANGWVEGADAVVRLLTDDTLRAVDALRAKSFHPREVDVVMVETPHKPGMLRHVTERLATAGIDLHHLYASATPDQERCLIVFGSANNDRAIVVLNE